MAKTSIKYENTPNNVIAKTTNHCVTVKETNGPKKGIEITPPTTVSINAYKEIVIEFINDISMILEDNDDTILNRKQFKNEIATYMYSESL